MKKRLLFVDNLRSILVLLLIVYHLAMAYNCWGEPNYIHLGVVIEISDIVGVISPWFMGLMFLLAGISAKYSLEKRGYKRFIVERLLRLGIPFLLCTLLLCPVLSYIADVTHNGYTDNFFAHYAVFFTRFTDLSGYDGGFTIGHLWFLLVLLVISIVVLPFIKLASLIPEKKKKVSLIIFGIVASVTATATLYIRPFDRPLITFLAVYLLGYYLFNNETFIDFINKFSLTKYSFVVFVLVSIFIVAFYNSGGDIANVALMVCAYISFVFGILTIFTWGRVLFDFTDKPMAGLAKISTIIYIVHFPVVVLAQYLLSLTGINNVANFFILLVILYPTIVFLALGISKVPFLRLIFGYKKSSVKVVKPDRYSTCCYIKKDECYLLLYRNKKENDVNKGKWIGVGGGFEKGETADECAIREVKEETGLDVHSLECAGEVDFIYDGYYEKMYIYEITDFSGNLIECDEGELKWIPIKNIYDYPMWEGDKVFLPMLINHDSYFKIRLTYERDVLVNVTKY